MKRSTLIAIPIIAWIIWASTPSKLAIESSSVINPIIDNTKSRALSLLPKNELLEQYNIPDKKDTWIDSCNSLLFPSKVRTIWINRMAKGFLWNMSKGWLKVIHPPLVDVWWEKLVYCAGTIKGFFGFSRMQEDRSKAEDIYINKEWIDAWTLPNELAKLGFKQEINLMGSFDQNKVWEKDIVLDKESYRNGLINVWRYLKEKWTPWSLLFIYFNLSNYKWKVREYNEEQKRKNPRYNPHINTHQAMYLWEWSIQFKASELKIVSNWELQFNKNSLDIVNYIANFVQQRWWYKSALTDNTKNIIINNLSIFWELVNVSINWEKVDIVSELKKTTASRVQVKQDDIIEISWPVLLDWFHDANSNNRSISEYNHTRTMFYFEFVLPWSYTPSELMVPSDNFSDTISNNSLDDISNKLDITNLYYLKLYEDIDLKLKEAILRYKFWMHKLLENTSEEIDMINRIEEVKWSKMWYDLMKKFVTYKINKIKTLISTLSKEEKIEFDTEYVNQIRWLQIMWYLQHEWQINEWTTNINAPIPYFDTTDIEGIFKEYIEERKKELSEQNDEKCSEESKKFLTVIFYPMDNFAGVYNQVEDSLQKHTEQYPIFKKVSWLNLLQRNKFIDLIIDKISYYDVSNWKISGMRKTVIKIEYINDVLSKLLKETYTPKLPLSEVDRDIIKVIAKNEEEYNLLSYIITQENYEQWIPLRKFLKKAWRELWKTSSFGDYQIKLYNLFSKDKSLLKWPRADQILKAISFLENPELMKKIDMRLIMFEEVVEPDLKIVEKLKTELSSINDENREEKWKIVYELLKELFRFNDKREINIIWKIIQASLVLDKINEHYSHLNWWLENSWVLLDQIYYSKDLQTRYSKMLLTIHHRSEKTALIGNAENYILRLLECFWDDINNKDYPKLKKDFKWHIEYDFNVTKNHFSYYKDRLSFIDSNDEEIIQAINELNKEIELLIKRKLQAEDIYKLFSNQILKKYLEKSWFDFFPIPTMEEFENTPFRELFFDYAKTPEWRTAPKIYKFDEYLINWWIWLSAFIAGMIWLLIRKSKKKKKKEDMKNVTSW